MKKTIENVRTGLDKEVIMQAKEEGYRHLLIHIKRNPISYDYIFYNDIVDFSKAQDALNFTGEGQNYYAMHIFKMFNEEIDVDII